MPISTTTWTSTSVSAPDGVATYTLTLSIPAPYGVSSQGYYETPHVVEPHKPTNLSASYSQKDTGDASYVWTIDGVVVPVEKRVVSLLGPRGLAGELVPPVGIDGLFDMSLVSFKATADMAWFPKPLNSSRS